MRRRATTIVVLVVALALALVAPAGAAQWYKTDTHVHSTTSGDATADLGIISSAAKDRGYDALMITDHTATSAQLLGGIVSNHVAFDEDLTQWSTGVNGGISTAAVPAISGTQSSTGTQSLHFNTTSSTSGESYAYSKRGPNLRSGDITLKFSAYPTRVDTGSGMYVSVAIGGDDTFASRPPNGYTTTDGVPRPGKRVVFVWQIGDVRTPSADPDARIVTSNLAYTPNSWNTYTINVSDAIRALPAADQPLDLNALTYVKMAASSRSSATFDGYLDNLHLDGAINPGQGSEFVYRNGLVHNWDTAGFKMYPSHEIGYNRHTMRFDYGITDPSQFVVFKQGNLAVASSQQAGYPAQLNHPGLPGGVTQDEAITNQAYGADVMEVAERSDEEGYVKDVMVDTWDAILRQDFPLIGAWTSDAHRVERLGPSTYLWADGVGFDPLMQALFEGRSFLADNTYTGRAILSTDGPDDQPYAARYPTYVSPDSPLSTVRLKITGGIPAGARVMWLLNGTNVETDYPNGASFDLRRAFGTYGSSNYVRAELRSSQNKRLAMTQPIFFRAAPSALPSGMTYRVDRVDTPSGHDYTRVFTKGITSSSWDGAGSALTINTQDPAGSLVAYAIRTSRLAPTDVQVDGVSAPAASDQAAFDAATTSSWLYDSAKGSLRVKALHGGSLGSLRAAFGPGDSTPPPRPSSLKTRSGGAHVATVSWTPPADDSDVESYTIYRDGTAVDSVPRGTASVVEDRLPGTSTFQFQIDSVDAAGNHSARSAPSIVRTRSVFLTSFTPVADAYVNESLPTTKYGTQTSLRIDGSPILRSYLRFDVAGLPGQVERATLNLHSNSTSRGFDVFAVSDNSWVENQIRFNNAPPFSSTLAGSGGASLAGGIASADITSMITGNGTYSMVTNSPVTSAATFASREAGSGLAPVLEVETSGLVNSPPSAAGASLQTQPGTPVNFTPSVSDVDGDSVDCEVLTAPAAGTVSVASDCSQGTYTPAPGARGADSFTYRANDTQNTHSGPATVNVVVNSPPSAQDRSFNYSPGSQASWTPSVSDPDGEATTCQILTQPAYGVATVDANCSAGTYTPNGGYSGPDSFTYGATDASGLASAPATVSASDNTLPTAGPRSIVTPTDSPVGWTPDVADADNDPLTCAIVSPPAHGTATVASDCSSGGYTPAAGYSGTDSFTYRATDDVGGQSPAATVSVRASRRPTVGPVALGTNEGQTKSWSPVAADADGDPITCDIVTAPAHGTATVTSDCSSGSYTPAAGYRGPDSLSYRATDDAGLQSAPATVTVSVNGRPVTGDRSLTALMSQPSTWTPSASDPEGDPITCSIVAAPAQGTATVAANCSTGSYRPTPGYHGSDSFTYRAVDSGGAASSPGTVTVRVNRAPTASGGSLTAFDGRAAGWRPGVSDQDGDTTTCDLLTPPAHGSVVLGANCGASTYQPASGYSGADSFTYRATDSGGATSDVATVDVTIEAAMFADGMESGNGSAWTTVSGLAAQGAVVRTGSFAFLGDTTTGVTYARKTLSRTVNALNLRAAFRIERLNNAVTLGTVRTASGTTIGTIFVSAGGKLSFRNSITGVSKTSTTSVSLNAWHDMAFMLTVGASTGSADFLLDGTRVTGLVTTGANLGSTPIGSIQIGESSSALNYRIALDDVSATDVTNHAPSAGATSLETEQGVGAAWSAVVSDPEGRPQTCEIVSAPAHGSASVASNCASGSYTPASGYHGSDSFTYRTLDDAGVPSAPATVSVTVNGRPAAGDRTLTVPLDQTGNWTPSVSDPDGDPVTCQILDAPVHGTATVAGDCSTGTYTPAAGYSGPDSFTYRATDSQGGRSNAGQVSVRVDRAPSVSPASFSAESSVATAWSPAASDPDGDALTCEIVDSPAHGVAGVAPDCSTGSYTSAIGYRGSDSFTYRATDDAGLQSSAATVSVSVNGLPTAADRSLTVPAGGSGTWTPSASDPDGDAITCQIVSAPSNGSATVAGDCSTGTYTPASGYDGSDSFTYRATDALGGASSPATVSVRVNRPPQAGDRALTTAVDAQKSWTPSASDPDGDPVTCAIVSAPANGTASVASDCSTGSYTPTTGYDGADSFTYGATDDAGASSTAGTVSVTVDRPPTAQNRSIDAQAGQATSWTPSVADPDGDATTCEIVGAPSRGNATVANDCSTGSYTSSAGYDGADSFTYRAIDSRGIASAAATVTVAVHGAPTANDVTLNAPLEAATAWTPSYTNPDPSPATCQIVSPPSNGTAGVQGACSTGSYTGATGFRGSDSFTYRVTSAGGTPSNVATVNVTVGIPVFSDDFESGGLGAWTTVRSVSVESAFKHAGTYGAEATTTTGATYLRKTLPSTYATAAARTWFRVASNPSSVNLLLLRTAAGATIEGAYVTSTGRLALRNSVTGVAKTSTRSVTTGDWHELEIRATVAGAGSRTGVYLDGTLASDLSATGASLGTTPIGSIQLGESSAALTYSIFFDDAAALR